MHAALDAAVVAAGIADEDQAVPYDRRGRYGCAFLLVGDLRMPQARTGLFVRFTFR
jgi:hypothetical protein